MKQKNLVVPGRKKPYVMAHRGQIVCPLDPTPEPRLWFYHHMKVDAILTDNPKVTCQRVRKYEDD